MPAEFIPVLHSYVTGLGQTYMITLVQMKQPYRMWLKWCKKRKVAKPKLNTAKFIVYFVKYISPRRCEFLDAIDDLILIMATFACT